MVRRREGPVHGHEAAVVDDDGTRFGTSAEFCRENIIKLTGTRPQVYGILTHKTTDEGAASVYLAAIGSEAAGGARGSARMPPTASIARTEM